MNDGDEETIELGAAEDVSASRGAPSRRWIAGAIGIGLALVAMAGTGGYFLGQSSRLSDEQVEERLTDQAIYDRRVYEKERRAALADLERQLERSFGRRITTEKAEASAEGRAEGESAGYASGQESGFSSGKEEGRLEGEAEGYGEGFEEGTCYVPGTYEYIC